MRSTSSRPFPMTMELEFVDRLHQPVRDGKAESVSAIIREALASFDFSNVVVVHPPQVQISVRLPARIRQDLKKQARAKHTSVSQLVRSAVEAYLPVVEARPPPPRKKRSRKPARRKS